MAADLQSIINAAADDADDFLTGVSSMTEARPAIREYLLARHPKLSPAEVQRVVAGLLAILDEEGFFEARSGPDTTIDDRGGASGGSE